MKTKYVVALFASSIFLFAFVMQVYLGNRQKSEIAASVDGALIYRENIEKTVTHFNKPEVTYDDVLNNTINEMVVVLSGEKLGITVPETEYENFIGEYTDHYPLYYNMGVEIYGKEMYLNGLRVNQNYRKVKEYLLANVIIIEPIEQKDLLKYIEGRFEWSDLTEEEKHSVYDIVENIRIEDTFRQWVENERINIAL